MLDLSSHVSRLSSNFPLYLVVFENLTHTLFLLHIMLRNHCTSGGEAYSYYYRSFSCFLAKIFPCAFLLREALSQTAEPPEPFASFAINVLFLHGILSNFIGPAARLFCLFSVFCGLNFRIFRDFRGSSINDLVAANGRSRFIRGYFFYFLSESVADLSSFSVGERMTFATTTTSSSFCTALHCTQSKSVPPLAG